LRTDNQITVFNIEVRPRAMWSPTTQRFRAIKGFPNAGLEFTINPAVTVRALRIF
jgi:hypothetical protein